MWAYPQPDQSLDEIAFTLTSALLGRVHLSGFLNLMSDEQFDLVRSAISVYKDIRPEISGAHPFWPLGLPAWEDTWIVHGLRSQDSTYLAVWRREHRESGGETVPSRHGQNEPVYDQCTLTLPHLRGAPVRTTVLHPATADAAEWDAANGKLTVSLPRANTAVLLRLSSVSPQ